MHDEGGLYNMIRILVDSSSDIGKEELVVNNMTMVPLSITFDKDTYLDRFTITNDEFYKKLTTLDIFPKTSQPSPNAYVEAFEEAKKAGDELICILLSSAISGTYQSAVLAKNIVDYDKIYLIDSLSATYGIQILVKKALEMIKEGKTSKEIISVLEELKKKVKILLSVDTLDYLYKGGRVDKTSAVIGNIAKIKPIITLSAEGKVEVISKTIGKAKAMNVMISMAKDMGIEETYPLATIFTTGHKNCEKLETKLLENEITITERVQIGPTIGTHVGVEAFGFIFVSK